MRSQLNVNVIGILTGCLFGLAFIVGNIFHKVYSERAEWSAYAEKYDCEPIRLENVHGDVTFACDEGVVWDE